MGLQWPDATARCLCRQGPLTLGCHGAWCRASLRAVAGEGAALPASRTHSYLYPLGPPLAQVKSLGSPKQPSPGEIPLTLPSTPPLTTARRLSAQAGEGHACACMANTAGCAPPDFERRRQREPLPCGRLRGPCFSHRPRSGTHLPTPPPQDAGTGLLPHSLPLLLPHHPSPAVPLERLS